MYTRERPVMSNPNGWLEFGFIYHLRIIRGERVLVFWMKEASYGKVTRKSIVNGIV